MAISQESKKNLIIASLSFALIFLCIIFFGSIGSGSKIKEIENYAKYREKYYLDQIDSIKKENESIKLDLIEIRKQKINAQKNKKDLLKKPDINNSDSLRNEILRTVRDGTLYEFRGERDSGYVAAEKRKLKASAFNKHRK